MLLILIFGDGSWCRSNAIHKAAIRRSAAAFDRTLIRIVASDFTPLPSVSGLAGAVCSCDFRADCPAVGDDRSPEGMHKSVFPHPQ
jgi:hypothetical protein